MFDEEKLAWVNRHYLKIADAGAARGRVARGIFIARGIRRAARPTARWPTSSRCCRWRSARSIGSRRFRTGSRFLFTYDAAAALERPDVAEVVREPGARDVIAALADEIDAPLLDRETFRAMANRVKERTGQKGKALFHPIRVALTGEGGGPELDLAVPAIRARCWTPGNRTGRRSGHELPGPGLGVRGGSEQGSEMKNGAHGA